MENFMDIETALNQIVSVVGLRGLMQGADADRYLQDERGLFHGEAALVVKPASVAECSQIIAIAQESGIGVIPQGGNTGYCGGATSFDSKRQIILNLSRMNNVREVDPVNFTMTVEAGMILTAAHTVAQNHGLMFPLSMGSQGSCQIGGVLSTNAGGISVLRYGSARDLVLGIEVVLPNGELLSELKGLRKDNTGYDLKGLFVGAEGTLGVITAAVLRLFPEPRNRQIALLGVTTPQAACDFLARVRKDSGEQVVSAEYISRESLDIVLDQITGTRDPFDKAVRHVLLLELATSQGDAELRNIFEQILQRGIASGEIINAVIAESGQQASEFWKLRESIPEAERGEGGSVKHDISVRISKIPEFLKKAETILGAIAPHRLSVFGHVGDGNLHYNLLPPIGSTLESFKEGPAKHLSESVHDLAVMLGGSFSAEHGVGILKCDELRKYKSPVAVGLMRTLKRAVDPRGIMNPGKVLG
jgi:FAD/FMN-containing dehydrogenase